MLIVAWRLENAHTHTHTPVARHIDIALPDDAIRRAYNKPRNLAGTSTGLDSCLGSLVHDLRKHMLLWLDALVTWTLSRRAGMDALVSSHRAHRLNLNFIQVDLTWRFSGSKGRGFIGLENQEFWTLPFSHQVKPTEGDNRTDWLGFLQEPDSTCRGNGGPK